MNRQFFPYSYPVQNALCTWRYETLGDKKYLVVNGVPLVEGVLNQRYVGPDQFGAFVNDWNGVPVVLRHPRANGGSARVPTADVPTIGRFYNAQMDGTRLVGEFWLDEAVLQSSDDGKNLIIKIQSQKPIEVSTGYYAESIPQAGQWNGKEYGLVDQNLHPDHIALLPDEIGACSVKDGCGMNRNESEEVEIVEKSTLLDAIQNVTGLTGAAATMWEEVYQKAKDEYNDEERAAKVAWAAVKKVYSKNEQGDWVKKNVAQKVKKLNIDISPQELEGLASLAVFVAN